MKKSAFRIATWKDHISIYDYIYSRFLINIGVDGSGVQLPSLFNDIYVMPYDVSDDMLIFEDESNMMEEF